MEHAEGPECICICVCLLLLQLKWLLYIFSAPRQTDLRPRWFGMKCVCYRPTALHLFLSLSDTHTQSRAHTHMDARTHTDGRKWGGRGDLVGKEWRRKANRWEAVERRGPGIVFCPCRATICNGLDIKARGSAGVKEAAGNVNWEIIIKDGWLKQRGWKNLSTATCWQAAGKTRKRANGSATLLPLTIVSIFLLQKN